MSSKNCQFCGKSISKENLKEHLKSDCEYVQIEISGNFIKGSVIKNSVVKCRLCEEVIKFNHKIHVNSCKHFYKFAKKCSSGFECTLCPYSTTHPPYYISRGTMTRHLRLNHGILKTDPIPSDNTVLGNVENSTGYLFFHRVIMDSLKRKIHLLIAKKDFEFHLLFFRQDITKHTRSLSK